MTDEIIITDLQVIPGEITMQEPTGELFELKMPDGSSKFHTLWRTYGGDTGFPTGIGYEWRPVASGDQLPEVPK